MIAGSAVSPTASLRGDLSELTEYLCHAAARIAARGLDSPPPAFEWSARRIALAPMLAHLHGLASLLALAQTGFPPQLADIFARHRALGAARARRLIDLRDAFVSEARACGAAPIALKGARTLDTLYADPSLRPMADLDFLCTPGELSACYEASARLGLPALGGTARHAVFGRPDAPIESMLAEHPDNPVKIEVHTRLAETFLGDTVDVTAAMVRPGAVLGHVLHALLHASHHASARTLRFCQIVDLGLMLGSLDEPAWRALMDALHPLGLWWAYAPLALAHAYFPGAVDPATFACARRAAPWLARRATWRMTDVSYSSIGDGGLRVRLRWARRPTMAVDALSGVFIAQRSRNEREDAPGLVPAFWSGSGIGWKRGAAWLLGRGIRPVTARLIQLAPSAWELPE